MKILLVFISIFFVGTRMHAQVHLPEFEPAWKSLALQGKIQEALRSIEVDGLTLGDDFQHVVSFVCLGLQSKNARIVSVAVDCFASQSASWIDLFKKNDTLYQQVSMSLKRVVDFESSWDIPADLLTVKINAASIYLVLSRNLLPSEQVKDIERCMALKAVSILESSSADIRIKSLDLIGTITDTDYKWIRPLIESVLLKDPDLKIVNTTIEFVTYSEALVYNDRDPLHGILLVRLRKLLHQRENFDQTDLENRRLFEMKLESISKRLNLIYVSADINLGEVKTMLEPGFEFLAKTLEP